MIYYDLERKKPVEKGKFINEEGYSIITEGEFYCFGNSKITVRDNSIVKAYDNSLITARDNSQVKDLRSKKK
jgi:hypothetical protein